MRMRGMLAAACDEQQVDRRVCKRRTRQLVQCYEHRWTSLPVLPSYQGLVSQHLICFTQASILHPCYASEVTIEHRNYPSVQHYLLAEAVDYFGSI